MVSPDMHTLPSSVAKDEKWSQHFLALLQEARADYELNRNAKGRFTECLRPLGPIWLSQSTICIRGHYSHCFAVTLTDKVAPLLNSPFWAGARFDQHHTIFWAFERDLGAAVRGAGRHPGLHSTHSRRTGVDSIVRQCTANAEQHLAPHYFAELQRGAPALMGVLEVLMDAPGLLDNPDFLSAFARPLPDSQDLSWRHFAYPPSEWAQFGLDLPKVLAASCKDKFAPHASQFEQIYGRLASIVSTATTPQDPTLLRTGFRR